MTATQIRWVLVNTTSSLPYILIMFSLLWVHTVALRQGTKRTVPALRTAFLITLVTSGGFVFNQPPFRFMVSGELNALVKDLVLVVQSLLLTVLADQLRGKGTPAQWGWRALLAFIPIAHTSLWYITKSSITTDTYAVVRVPLTLTLYTLLAYAYSCKQFYVQQRETGSHLVRWRLRTLLWGLGAIMFYIVGRGTMEFLPETARESVVWVNRIGLTIGTLLTALGLAMPRWYGQVGTLVHVVRHGGQHLDNFVGLLAMISDREIGLKSPARIALRRTALWAASQLDLPPESRELVSHAAQLSPTGELHAGRPVPPCEEAPGRRLDITASIILYSAVYEVLQLSLEPQAGRLRPEAQILLAARLYLEGESLAALRRFCSPEVTDLFSTLLAEESA